MAVRVKGCLWLFFGFVRIIWTIWPQTGYIHPDEFFQAPEVTAGNIYGIVSSTPWEFNETFPVRSVVFPYLMTGLPFKLLKLISEYQITIISAKNLVVAARILFCFFSFAIDFVVWKICLLLSKDPWSPLCVIGTSYVTLVFYTRPFSNSTESFLFAVLLLLVISENCSSPGNVRTKGVLKMFVSGIVLTAGFWNRPTFLSFALVPLLGWLYCVCRKKGAKTVKDVVCSTAPGIVSLCVGVIPTAALFVLCDSLYFGFLAKKKLVLTPLNFLMYNLDSESLKDHGIHPRITHLFVNFPLLFGPLAFVCFCFGMYRLCLQDYRDLIRTFYSSVYVCGKDETKKEKVAASSYIKNINFTILGLSAIVPVCMLSVMPHQEPRFIIPVLAPLAIIFGHMICSRAAFRILKVLWVLWNVVGCIVFGILHHGGMYPCMSHLQTFLATDIKSTVMPTTYNIVFFHTYMPPQHLLIWPKYQKQENKNSGMHALAVYDMAGASNGVLLDKISHIMNEQREKKAKSGQNYVVLVVAPSTVKLELAGLRLIKQFTPHLSLEDLPHIDTNINSSFPNCDRIPQRYVQDNKEAYYHCSADADKSLVTSIRKQLSLNLYRIIP